MNSVIFLALLCLGIASAAPKVDDSLDAEATLWKATPGEVFDTDEDTMGAAVVEKTTTGLEDNQGQSDEQQSFGPAVNASEYINLKIKLPKGVFGKIKHATRKGKLGNIAKGFGKNIRGKIKKPTKLGEVAKGVGKHILGEIKNPENLAEIVKSAAESILDGLLQPKSVPAAESAVTDATTVEFEDEDVLAPEPEAQKEERTTTENPESVHLGEEDSVPPATSK